MKSQNTHELKKMESIINSPTITYTSMVDADIERFRCDAQGSLYLENGLRKLKLRGGSGPVRKTPAIPSGRLLVPPIPSKETYRRFSFVGTEYNHYVLDKKSAVYGAEAGGDTLRWGDPYAFLTGDVGDEGQSIAVIDLDCHKWKQGNEHPFIQWFVSKGAVEQDACWQTTLRNIIKFIDTFAVRTASGGFHLYFNLQAELGESEMMRLPCSTNRELEIDVRGEGGYIVGFGTKFGTSSYEVCHIPENTLTRSARDHKELFDFVIPPTSSIKDKKRVKRDQLLNTIDESNSRPGAIRFHFAEGDVESIVADLPSEYFTNFDLWFKFTAFCKSVNRKDIWLSKGDGNLKQYDWDYFPENDIGIVKHIFDVVGRSDELAYHVYKPVLVCDRKPTTPPTDHKKLGYDYIDTAKHLVIKAHPMTGKTTSVKHYLMPPNAEKYSVPKKFICIVSRVSLADDLYRVFNDHVDEFSLHNVPRINHYNKDGFKSTSLYSEGESVIITIESIHLIQEWDFSEYTIFIDEFNSVVEHLVSSDTLNTRRRNIINHILPDVMRNCQQVIGVDADVSELCFKFLENNGIKDYEYRINTHRQTKNITAKEHFDFALMVKKIKKLDKFMVCCDSATEARKLYEKLDAPADVVVIDKHYKGDINLELLPKVIFSPKIVYGLDSTMGREVFCIFNEHTISPKSMFQQACRERKMEKLHYIFLNKRYINNDCLFDTLDDVIQRVKDLNQYANDKYGQQTQGMVDSNCSGDPLYDDILSYYLYQQDAYKSNKFCHWKIILKEAEMNDGNLKGKMKRRNIKKEVESKKHSIERLFEQFDINDIDNQRKNEILNIPLNKVDDWKGFFIDDHKLKQHFAVSKLFFETFKPSSIKIDLQYKEFSPKVVESLKSKCHWILDIIKGSEVEMSSLIPNKPFEKEVAEDMLHRFCLIFSHRAKNIKKEFDLTNPYCISKLLYKAIKVICGKGLYDKKTTKIPNPDDANKRINHTIYTQNTGEMKVHTKLHQYRS